MSGQRRPAMSPSGTKRTNIAGARSVCFQGHLSLTSGFALICSICREAKLAGVGYLKRAIEETVASETLRPDGVKKNSSPDDPHRGRLSRRSLLLAGSS